MSNGFPKRIEKNAKANAKTLAVKTSDVHQPQVSRIQQEFSSTNILYLQRTIGNKAVSELLSAQAHSSAGTSALVIQRKLMSYAEFLKKTGQSQTDKERFSDTKNRNVGILNQTRQRLNPNANPMKPEYLHSMADGLRRIIDINAAYEVVSKDENIANLARLYDSITYWQAMYGTMPETKQYAPVLNQVLAEIKVRVNELSEGENKKKQTSADYKLADDSDEKSKSLTSRLKAKVFSGRRSDDLDYAAEAYAVQMPPFMKDLDITQAWFEANCLDESRSQADGSRIRPFFDISVALQKQQGQPDPDNIAAINKGITRIETQFGTGAFYMIKQNLFSRYRLVLGENFDRGQDVVGAGQLTPQEIEAIIRYSTQDYQAINGAARFAKPQVEPTRSAKRLGTPPTREALEAAMAEQDMNNKIALTVSGLNKLPRFVGTTYRGLKHPPEGFVNSIAKGAPIADLGFASSSPSMAVVYEFLHGEQGARNIFYILHSRTGVNIVELSFNVREGEVLFRPGTRFIIDNIWKHDEKGHVPAAAPPEAKMILHRKDREVDANGVTYADYMKQRDAAEKKKDLDKLFAMSWNGGFQTLVIEATEV